MNKKLLLLSLSALSLTGCSSPEPELSYDPVELIEYERCLNTVHPNFTEELWAIEGIAEEVCKDKKPLLK